MRFEFQQNGKTEVAEAEWVQGSLWIHLHGRSFIYESPSEKKAKSRQQVSSGQAGNLLAPMPGKITRILKSSGETVVKGDLVLVMEAMKMEYTLKSEGPGVIESIDCAVGDQVTLGKTLVRIKSSQES